MSLWSQRIIFPLPICSHFNIRTSLSSFYKRHLTITTPSRPTKAASDLNRPFPSAAATTTIISPSQLEALSPVQKEQISVYVDALLQWNQKMNLTAATEESEVMARHVEDSLAILPPLQRSYLAHCTTSSSLDGISFVDVGSGAGLPGLIIAIACPSWEVTLLESMRKRCLFLEHTIGLIGLQNVQILHNRAEVVGQSIAFRETFDVAVARAVAEMRILAEYCLPLVRVGGLFIAAKGYDPLEEVKTAEHALKLVGASMLEMSNVESHGPHGQRTAVICLKDCATPSKYPRRPGVPSKMPL